MSNPRLPGDRRKRKFGSKLEANGPLHRRHADSWRLAMYRYAAEVSRLTGIHERELQYWWEWQSARESPSERMARAVRALIDIGAPDALAPLDELLHEFYRSSGEDDLTEVDLCAGAASVLHEVSEAVQAALDAVATGSDGGVEITALEYRRWRRELQEAYQKLELLDRHVDVLAKRSGVEGVG